MLMQMKSDVKTVVYPEYLSAVHARLSFIATISKRQEPLGRERRAIVKKYVSAVAQRDTGGHIKYGNKCPPEYGSMSRRKRGGGDGETRRARVNGGRSRISSGYTALRGGVCRATDVGRRHGATRPGKVDHSPHSSSVFLARVSLSPRANRRRVQKWRASQARANFVGIISP